MLAACRAEAKVEVTLVPYKIILPEPMILPWTAN